MGRTYTTVQGDTWDAIAYKALGTTDETGRLMMCNRAWLDRYSFPAGVVLELPEERRSVSDKLPPWKGAAG